MTNSFFFVNASKIYQFKAKYSEKKHVLYLGNISCHFSVNGIKKGIKWVGI